MLNQIRADLAIIRERDPAARGWLEMLFAIQASTPSACTALAIDFGAAACRSS